MLAYPKWGPCDIFSDMSSLPSDDDALNQQQTLAINAQQSTEPGDDIVIAANSSMNVNDKNQDIPLSCNEQQLIDNVAVNTIEQIGQINDPCPNLDENQKKFEMKMNMLERRFCNKCKEMFMADKNSKKKCCHSKPMCASLSAENNMDPGDVPEELKNLTAIEEQLIARIHPVVSVYKLRKGQQLAYSGNVINFPQDIKGFAKKLPHNINDLSSMITVRTSKENVDFRDFQVHAERVRKALEWLQSNNPFYFDVQISEENLALIPIDGNLYDFVITLEIETENTNNTDGKGIAEDCVDPSSYEKVFGSEEEYIVESGVPFLGQLTEKDQVKSVIGWPEMENKPIDEFNTIGYVVQAFPCLFPTGKGDLRSPREIKVSETVYFQHLMRFHDERFAKHPRFRFFCLNSLMRWTALRDGKIFIERNPEFKNMTLAELKQKLEDDPTLIKKIMFQGNNLRGTKAYWYARGKELQSMIEQLGPPTLFITLSAADMHWPELFKLLAPNEDLTELSGHKRRQLIQENPMIVDEFFLTRAETFFQEVLTKKYKIKDHWFRIEYQHRGSPHLHGVVWLEDAPDITNIATASDDEKEGIIKYFDSLISTMHPRINEPPAPVHPCRMRLSEVIDIEQDLAQLLNRVQRHTQCTAGYCLRIDRRTKQQKCRFNFPSPMCETTSIDCSDKDNVQLITKRNDSRLNKYNKYIIQTWRGNIDVSPVLSIRALTNYLAKYISKSETRSESYIDLLKTIIASSDEAKTAKFALQRLYIQTCSERDFCAQEICHILMGLKLFSSGGRNFVSINFKEKTNWLRINEKSNGREAKSFIEKYKERDEEQEHKCMWEIAKYFKRRKSQKHNIVQIFPKLRFMNNADNEPYYRQQCLLYLPWRNEELLLGGSDTWENIYKDRINEIESNQTVALNMSSISPDEEDPVLEDIDNVLSEEQWMALSRMGPNQDTCYSDLGLRDCDLQKDWHATLSYYDAVGGLPFLQNFLANSKKTYQAESNLLQANTVQWSSEQQQIIDLVKAQITTLKTGKQNTSTFKKIIVQGKAGTGKSLLIEEISRIVTEEFGPNSIIILGPTGVSAVNINGSTIHSTLKINCRSKEFRELTGLAKHEFQKKFENVKFVILDEFSMIGCGMLHIIDRRLRSATGRTDEYFGGLNVFLFGDIKQLSPVGDSSAYSTNQQSDEYIQGKQLYDSFDAAIILTKIHRQKDEEFLKVLENISLGTVTEQDYKLLQSRFTTSVTAPERQQFKNSLHLYPKRADVFNYNKTRLETMKGERNESVPVVKISAQHNCRAASQGTSNDAEGLEPVLYLAENANIMLRANLWTEQGLFNGAMGKIVHILYHPDKSPTYDLPAVLVCQFDKYKGPYICEELKTVPIIPSTTSWTNLKTESCSRIQFPIALAYATSIHKSQGLTLEKAFVDIGSTEMSPGLSYVALSRAKSLNGLMLQPFPFKRLSELHKSKALHLRKQWETFLHTKTLPVNQ